ncbi:hypothetical protein BCR43DRAFT_526577 [Syncephalastrum racemosum]|uniref:Uncharacterized protein n=1 Tax=Syncephalastrum racemosum TaxID=13706 RepID=A0A1X2H6U8_SYNRA|nr:hypothetical protein BCR43DRAFT_526577 [Syncephalastrum racemosum]
MKSILVQTDINGPPKNCTRYHIQLLLIFIGVKYSHAQVILDERLQTVQLALEQEATAAERHAVDLDDFLGRLREALLPFHYTNPLTDLRVAWDIVHRNRSVCIILGGTSGCGKSTLASLLARRIGITTVLSTDHLRSLLRSFDSEKKSNLLWASSYHAGEDLDTDNATIAGYEAQSQLMFDTLDKMLTAFAERKESLVIEGVALSVDNIRKLAEKHPHCIPLVIYISNEHKHSERFAIRAKYMTVAPRANKYIKYFDNIRLIQSHLCQQANQFLIPTVDNTNVDRSLAILHTTVVNVMSRLQSIGASSLVDPATGKLFILHEEYTKVYEATWSSKQMLRRIRQNSVRSRRQPTRASEIAAAESCGSGQEQASCSPGEEEDADEEDASDQEEEPPGTHDMSAAQQISSSPLGVIQMHQTGLKAASRF